VERSIPPRHQARCFFFFLFFKSPPGLFSVSSSRVRRNAGVQQVFLCRSCLGTNEMPRQGSTNKFLAVPLDLIAAARISGSSTRPYDFCRESRLASRIRPAKSASGALYQAHPREETTLLDVFHKPPSLHRCPIHRASEESS